MAERLYRAQILLELKQRQKLEALANAKGRSVSDLVREAVAQYLSQEESERQAAVQAVERLEQARLALLRARNERLMALDPSELLTQLREERVNELTRRTFQRGD